MIQNNRITQQLSMPEVESALTFTYKMYSHTGKKIACSSLRPGMRIKFRNITWTVVQNSAKLKRVELVLRNMAVVYEYYVLACDPALKVYPPSLWYKIKRLFR